MQLVFELIFDFDFSSSIINRYKKNSGHVNMLMHTPEMMFLIVTSRRTDVKRKEFEIPNSLEWYPTSVKISIIKKYEHVF